MVRLAIIHKEKCKPYTCSQECKKFCPVEKKENDSCVVIKQNENNSKARIDEKTCVGCGICQKRCPFEAIEIVNLPEVNEKDLLYRYGENSFALYKLPVPREGSVLGLLGRNGIGKSTAVQLLSGKLELGCLKKFKGTELQKYFNSLSENKIAYKLQNLSELSKKIKVVDLLKQRSGDLKKVEKLAKKLGAENILENNLNKLSGGELQKVALIASVLGDADIYFFDEPLAYLDISERLRVSDFILELSKKKTVVVVEHDLLILDYLTNYINIFYGKQGVFGLVSDLKSSKNAINEYLEGFLKSENIKIRDKPLNFNFKKNVQVAGQKLGSWQNFSLEFENFKLDVGEGEICKNSVVGILGKNGTGKTSFVRALAGLEKVFINGKKTKINFGKNLEISYKPQYVEVEEGFVKDILVKEKINKKLRTVFNLHVLEQKKISQLSGGELQRFAVARCLAKDADLYLIDEPSAYLDVEERISVAKLIKESMTEKEKTAFVVDHDLLLISYLADKVIVFSGESGKFGKSSEVLEFEQGVSKLLKELDVTLRKDKETGRPRINKKGSVLDKEQKSKGDWVVF